MRRAHAAMVAVAFVLGGQATPAAAQQGDALTATVSTTSMRPGDTVQVRGSGWPHPTLIQVQVCGNQALSGSVDCDLGASRTQATADGSFAVDLVVGSPPSPCPCVVYVTNAKDGRNVRIPIDVFGLRTNEPSRPTSRNAQGVKLLSASLDGWGPVTSWFGAGARRTLVVKVQNLDSEPRRVTITAAVGKGATPSGVVRVPELEPVPPLGTRTYRVPVNLEPLSFGGYSVVGSVRDGAAEPFRAGTSTYPYGLVALLAVGAAWLARDRIVRRRSQKSATPEEAELST